MHGELPQMTMLSKNTFQGSRGGANSVDFPFYWNYFLAIFSVSSVLLTQGVNMSSCTYNCLGDFLAILGVGILVLSSCITNHIIISA